MPSFDSNDLASRCTFLYSDGRKCRMLRSSRKSKLCLHHERKLAHLREADDTASHICEPLAGSFVPATALTQSLTRVFRAAAEGRISPKSATALARVASTLLKSIDASSLEFRDCYVKDYWRQLVYDHYPDLPDFIDNDDDEDDQGSETDSQHSPAN